MNIVELKATIDLHRDSYYNGESVISDEEYDRLVEQYEEMTGTKLPVGTPVPKNSPWIKTAHVILPGSMEKLKDGVEQWFRAAKTDAVFVMPKFDGITLCLYYKNGRLNNAISRGDGIVGEDLLANALKVDGIPHTIPETQDTYIRGEVLCFRSNMDKFPEAANPRNVVSGTMRRYDGVGCENLSFVAYYVRQVDSDQVASQLDQFMQLEQWGFNKWGDKYLPLYFCSTPDRIKYIYNTIHQEYEQGGFDFDMDGVVIRVDSTDPSLYEGAIPEGMIAWKFPSKQTVTRLKRILWQTGYTGKVTPIAEFEPVSIAGATISYASLHSADNVERLFGKGEFVHKCFDVIVSRRNDVIPYIEEVSAVGEELIGLQTVASKCLVCGKQTKRIGADWYCLNLTCKARVSGTVARFIEKLGILGIGEQFVTALCEYYSIISVDDLFTINLDDPGMNINGNKCVAQCKKLKDGLIEKRTSTPRHVLYGAIGVPSWGSRMFAKAFQCVEPDKLIDMAMKEPYALIMKLSGNGAGETSVMNLHDSLAGGNYKTFKNIEAFFTFPSQKQPTTTSLTGKSFCFTGFRSKELEATIVDKGGEIKSGVSRGLNYLVTKDATPTSKTEAAAKYGTKIITKVELEDMLNE